MLPNLGRNAGKFHVEFDTRELTRGDFASQMKAFATGKQWGFFNTNYILRALGENPVEGPAGEAYWMPVNTQDAATPNQGNNAAEEDGHH